jgi:hypothetical protein
MTNANLHEQIKREVQFTSKPIDAKKRNLKQIALVQIENIY